MKVFAWICAGLMALAVIPAYADSGCSEKHENVSRFNPTELSDYQKCVHKFYGNEFGTVGNHVWMQHNDDFIYIHKNKLSNGVKEAILGAIIENEIETLKAEIVRVETVIEYVEDESITQPLRDKVDELELEIAGMQAVSNVVSGQSITDALNGALNDGKRGSFSEPREHTLDTSLIDGWPGDDYTVYTYEIQVGSSTVTITNDSRNTYPTINFTHAGSRAHNTGLEFANAISMKVAVDAIKTIVEDAYNEGYEDGYRDGYADGYRDGVNSVTN